MSVDVKLTGCNAAQLEVASHLLLGDSYASSQDSSAGLGVTPAPENVLIALVDERIVGAILVVAAAGQVGWIWAPAVRSSNLTPKQMVAIARELIRGGIRRLGELKTRLVQALVPPGHEYEHAFMDCGFRAIANMIRMVAVCRSPQPRERGALEFLTYAPELEYEFRHTVEQTYVASLDCPELDGLRPIDEVFEGYRAASEFRPELWALARQGGETVGCVLMAYFSDDCRCELQYMGVVPSARQRGHGRQLVREAFCMAGRIGATTIGLAVDARNIGASRLYQAAGFVELDRRAVLVLPLQ